MKRRTKITVWTAALTLAIIALGVGLWIHRFRTYTPVEVVLDLKAGFAARNAPKPVEQFLELRYGPLTQPENRQKAFLDFFNVGHIEGLQIIVKRMPASRRQENIAGMAQWVSNYRQTMSADEKQALGAFLRSDAGRMTVQQATAQYLSQDARYRAATAGVIEQLMITLAEIQKP